MSNATILKSPQEVIKDIQSYDRNILVETLVTSPKDLQDAVNFFESQKNLPGANVDLLNSLQNDCMQIMIEKIKLTKTVLGVNGNTATIIPNPQLNLNLEDKEVKESPEEVMTRTENKQQSKKYEAKVIDFNKAKKDLEDKNKSKETKAVSFQSFKGYTRKVIFGTNAEIPESIFHLVPLAESESDIDNIARHLIEENRVEDALNLSIDLFEKSKTAKKLQQEVEMRFINEILPWAYGITIKPFDSYQNITLAFWNNHLLGIVNNNKLIEEITDKAVEEMKSGEITAKTAIEIKTQFPNDSDKIFENVCQKLGIKNVKVEVAPTIPSNKKKEEESTVGLTYETLQNECVNKFKAGEAFKEVESFFKKEFENVVDKDKASKHPWGETAIKCKKIKDTVDKAEEQAFEGTKLSKDDVKKEAKSIIKKSLELGESAMNKFRQFIAHKNIRNTLELNKDNTEKVFNELKSEVEKENPEIINIKKPKQMVISNFKVEEMFPDVWESAKTCRNLAEFKDLLVDIVFNKGKIPFVVKGKTKEMDAWQVAANLTNQYINTFEGSKDWDDKKKLAFFTGIINATTEQRKKEKAKEHIEEATIVEETNALEKKVTTIEVEQVVETTKQEEVEVARSEQQTSSINLSKYDAIATEGNKGKLQGLMANFLLETSYKTFKERSIELRDKYMPMNNRWNKAPEVDRDNAIKKLIKNNDKLQEIAE